MPQITGVDFIIPLADQAAERGQPYAGHFRAMAEQAAIVRGELVSEVVATRPLEADEASPVSILLAAHEAAATMGDTESVTEVLRFGMPLLATWAEWLATIEQHPRLELGGSDTEN